MTWSRSSRKNIPAQKPTAAGMKDHFPISASACSSAGMIRLHMDAATITPAAKPDRALCSLSLMAFFINRTQEAPITVPRNGIMIP